MTIAFSLSHTRCVPASDQPVTASEVGSHSLAFITTSCNPVLCTDIVRPHRPPNKIDDSQSMQTHPEMSTVNPPPPQD